MKTNLAHITPANCEQRLRNTMDQIIRKGITTPEALRASRLWQELMLVMRFWAEFIAVPAYSGLLFCLWEDVEEFASDWLDRFWARGRNEDSPYSNLRSLLKFAHAHGSRAVPPYLMRCVHNYSVDRIEEYENGECRMGPFMGIDEDGCFVEVPASQVMDPNYQDAEQVVIHRLEMERFIRRLGGDLLQDLGMLSHALPINRHQMAVMIFAGKQVELCCEVARRLCGVLNCCSAAWEPFLRAAAEFRLPARMTSVEVLERHMYRRTTSRGREEFRRRVGGRPA